MPETVAGAEAVPDGLDVAEVEAAVDDALRRADDRDLTVLGYGEISLVVGWPTGAPRWACKRLPVFPDRAATERYRELVERYLGVLRDRGVQPVDSRFVATPAGPSGRSTATSGAMAGYVVQPVLPPTSLGPEVLRAAEPTPDHPLLRAVRDLVPAVVDERTGLDGQISNWALVDGEARYLDVTTPFLFDADGRLELDTALFLAAYPWFLRGIIDRWVAPSVIGAYREPRHVLLDLVANLVKERLDPWLAPAAAAASTAVDETITVEEARRYYRSDARLWEVMLRLRRADRWWQSTVRRRTYPFLLPRPVDR